MPCHAAGCSSLRARRTCRTRCSSSCWSTCTPTRCPTLRPTRPCTCSWRPNSESFGVRLSRVVPPEVKFPRVAFFPVMDSGAGWLAFFFLADGGFGGCRAHRKRFCGIFLPLAVRCGWNRLTRLPRSGRSVFDRASSQMMVSCVRACDRHVRVLRRARSTSAVGESAAPALVTVQPDSCS